MERKASQDALLWGLVGCGGILFLVLIGSCIAGMVLVGRRGLPDLPRPTVGSDPPAPVPPPGAPPPTAPVPPGKPPPPLAPVRIRVAVTSVTGSLSGRVLGGCDVSVSPPASPGAMCQAVVLCDGLPLYGGGGTGFFRCQLGPGAGRVVGNDADTTADDGDAAFTLDTDARTFRLRDDDRSTFGAYALEGTP